HLLSLINEILDLSKIEASRAELHPSDFDLQMLARSLETTFKPLCAQQRIQFFTCVHDKGILRVQGDEGKLRQVLINLIGNAVKFTRVGEVTLNVRLNGPDRWMFEVTDTGLGIPQDEQAHIFKPFHQGSGAQHLGGTGLGLAIAQRQVQLLGGELQLDSDRGAGSRFHFEIPLEAAATQAPQPPSAFAKLSAGQRLRALVVDDRKENRDVLGGMLTAVGGKVLFAKDGDEAIATLRREILDVVFLDWLMPGISRANLVQTLFSEQLSRPVIIAHSASILPEHREEALAAGCAEFLVKPLSWS